MTKVTTLRVSVNPDLCQGHARCAAIAPDLFRLNDIGNAEVRGDGEVPAALIAKARLAQSNCPEFAISIVEG